MIEPAFGAEHDVRAPEFIRKNRRHSARAGV